MQSFTLADIPTLATMLINQAIQSQSPTHATLITFSGDLGAGKTTLIQEIARQLGINETLTSPTFVIYKKYELPQGAHFQSLVHGDMYRLESADDMKKLSWDELINDSGLLICIEWPEKIQDIIPEWAIRVMVSHTDAVTRTIDIQKS